MIRLRFLAAALTGLLTLFTSATAGPAVSIKDMAGRNLQVPQTIRKAYCMSPVCQIILYTLAPDMLAGWNYQTEPGEYALLVPPYRDLPVLGGWFGRNNTGNLEEILRSRPDIMISLGDPLATATAEQVQKQTGIPVYIGDWSLKKLPETYLAMGRLLHREARAKLLADYCHKTLQEIESKVKTIPPGQRRRVYYAEGPTGLATDPARSAHSESILFAGGINVAEVPDSKGYGETPVSMEQILIWNPDVILAGYDHSPSTGAFYRGIWQNPLWQRVKAVQAKDVYEAPQYPFNWIDRPPSANRIIGIKWLAHLFYPKLFPMDLRAETRSFYHLFYHRDLSKAELDRLLDRAIRHP